ncbi:hypothetical protein LINGRAHAP2_LOCUS22903 [Linum grandiflorum]
MGSNDSFSDDEDKEDMINAYDDQKRRMARKDHVEFNDRRTQRQIIKVSQEIDGSAGHDPPNGISGCCRI